MDAADLTLLQNTLTFWNHLTTDEKSVLSQGLLKTNYSAGENIHSADNDCIGLLIVKSGELRAYILSEEGKEFTLFRLNPGDVCTLSASCLFNSITFDVYIDSETTSEVFVLNSYALSKLQEKNIYVENFALKIVTQKFSTVIGAMEKMLFYNFEQRLAAFLLEETLKTNSMEIKLTHEQIAKYIGTAREVVSRTLKHFEKDGIVKLFRGGLQIIDLTALKRYNT